MAEQGSHDAVVNQSPSDGELKVASDVNDERLKVQESSASTTVVAQGGSNDDNDDHDGAAGGKKEDDGSNRDREVGGGQDARKGDQNDENQKETEVSPAAGTNITSSQNASPSLTSPSSPANTASPSKQTANADKNVAAPSTTDTPAHKATADNTTPTTPASSVTITSTVLDKPVATSNTTATTTTAAAAAAATAGPPTSGTPPATTAASRTSSTTRLESTPTASGTGIGTGTGTGTGTTKTTPTATTTTTTAVKKSAFKPVSFAKFSINKPAATAGAAGAIVVGGGEKKGTFSTTPSVTSSSSPAAASSRPRLVAKTGSGLTGSLSRAGGAGSQGTPRAVWNKNQAPQQTPSSLPASAAKHLTDEELQQRYGIHMTSRLPSHPPPFSSSTSHPESGADGSKPAEHHSQWADEDDDEDDWTPETITWTDGTKHKITPLGEAKTIVKLTPAEGGEKIEEKIVIRSSAELEKEKEKEKAKAIEDEIARGTDKKIAAATSASSVSTVRPFVKSKLSSSNTTVLKVGQSMAERAGQAPGSLAGGKTGDAHANAKSSSSLPAKSPWAPLPPVQKISPVAIAAEVAQQTREQHPPHHPPSHFDHDRDRFGPHGYGGHYGGPGAGPGGGGHFYSDRHPHPPHSNFRERDFPHAFSNLRDPALQPFASPPLPSSQGPYHSHHPPPYPHGHHGPAPPPPPPPLPPPPPPPREIAADDFNRTWRDHPASSAPRELFNSRSGRYEPVDPALSGPHHRRERGDRERRPTQLLQRSLGEEKPAGDMERAGSLERGRALSNVSAAVETVTQGSAPESGATIAVDRTRSLSPNVVVGAIPEETGPEQVTVEPEEDPVAMQQRIMKEKIAAARRRRQEDEAREEAAKQERIRQRLAAMGPPPVSKSQKEKEKEKEKEKKEKEKEKEVWTRKEIHVPAAAGAEKTPEQAKATPATTAATIDTTAAKADLQNPPPPPPVVEPSGEPKQYGLMKVHAPEPVQRMSHDREETPDRLELLQQQQQIQAQQTAEQRLQWQQAATAAVTTPNTTSAIPAGTICSPLSTQAQAPSLAPSTTTVSPFSPWVAPPSKLAAPGAGPSTVWGSPNAERALGNGTFDRNFAGFRCEAPPPPPSTQPVVNASPAAPLGIPTSMALDGLTSSPLSPETRGAEHLPPIGRPAGPPRPICPPQQQVQQQGSQRAQQNIRIRSPQIAAWHNLHNVVAEAEADENENFQKEMAAMREEEVRQGRPMPVKFNQTWRKVEVGDEVGSRQIVGVTKTEHDHGGLITTQQQQPMDVTATAASPVVPAVQVNLSTTSPGAAPVTLSPLHGLGNVAGLSPFPENATRPLGSNTARESRFFPHGGNVSVQERRVSQSSQFSPPIPVVPLSLPTALPMTPSPLPASHEPLPLVLGERSSSPPPPEEYSSAHPVYSFESTRPLVHLPNPKPVVRLPPSAQPSPALLQRPHETPRHGETRHSHIQHSHDSHVSISAVAGSLRSSGYTGEVHLATWWQEKIDGLLGKKSASASPALSASMGGKNALVVSSSTKEPYDVLTMPGTAAVCLPNGMEGLGLEATFPPILQVASKNVEEEEEIFEDREAGSLPVVRVPAMAPPKAWEPVLPRPEARARSKFVKPVQAVSKEAFSIANLNRDNDNVIVKFVFMGEAKVVNMPRSGSYGASRGRGGGRARRGGKGRGESGASYDRKSHTRHSSSSGAGSASPSAGSSHVSHAQQPPTAPKTVTASAVPPTAPRTANTQPVAKAVSPAPTVSKPAYPPSTQPMTWASRVARGV